jgi:hypothetical protein
MNEIINLVMAREGATRSADKNKEMSGPLAASDASYVAVRTGDGRLTRATAVSRSERQEPLNLSSRPEDSHLRALPDPYVNLSIHTAPDVRPFP